MDVYRFQSTKRLDVFGFTAEETGSNLPDDLGPWAPLESGAVPTGSDVGASKPIVAAVKRDGFYLTRSETVYRNPEFS
jgi:hypothetical protein